MKNSNYISIKQFLENIGVNPVKDSEYYGLYYSPLREDANPSFKVDYQKNLWYDFGMNEGGSIVDLVMKLERCSLAEAFQKLDNSFSFHRNTSAVPVMTQKQESEIKIQNVIPLAHPVLIGYLKERHIDMGLAKQYCSEVHYEINNKPYYAIGFRNDTGGWALRNEYFKGCILSMGVTFLNTENKSEAPKETCLLFEGFTDFLSYLILKKSKTPKHDTIILNSVSNLYKAKDKLSEYKTISTFLDNDEGGKRAIQNLHSFHKGIQDQSAHYANHKDLNDYLCSRFAPKQAIKKTPSRGRRM